MTTGLTPWTLACAILLFGWLPCAIAAMRGTVIERLAAAQAGGVLLAWIVVCLTRAWQEPYLLDLALAFALLDLGSGLVITRFWERWL